MQIVDGDIKYPKRLNRQLILTQSNDVAYSLLHRIISQLHLLQFLCYQFEKLFLFLTKNIRIIVSGLSSKPFSRHYTHFISLCPFVLREQMQRQTEGVRNLHFAHNK